MKDALAKTVEATDVVVYDYDEAYVAELDRKYIDITDIETDTDLEMVKGGQREYRELRLAVDEWHKTNKKPFLARAKAYDKEKNRVRTLLEPGETHLKVVRETYESKIKQVELDRIRGIQDKIQSIRKLTMGMAEKTAAELTELYTMLKGRPIHKDEFEELTAEAMTTVHNVLIDIDLARKNREHEEYQEAKRKDEEVRLAKERERLKERDRQQKEEEALAKAEQKKAQAKIDKANAEIQEERDALEADKRADAQRKRENEIARQAQEGARLAEKARVERERVEAIEQEKAEKEEAARQKRIMPDKDKFYDLANTIASTVIPEIKRLEAQAVMAQIEHDIIGLSESIKMRADDL